MKLLFVVNIAEFFLSHRLPLAKAAAQAGYEVHVATANSSAVETIKRNGFVHHLIPFRRWGTNPFHELKTLFALIRLYRKLKPDLVHQVTVKPVLYGSLAAQLTGVPALVNAVSGLGYVFVTEGIGPALLRRGVRLAYKLVFLHPHKRFIFQNTDDRDAVLSMGILKEKDTVLINGSGVSPEEFAFAPEPEGELKVVFPARLLVDKGIHEYLGAARRLKEKFPSVRFQVAGGIESGYPTSLTEAEVKELEAQGGVDWLGFQTDMPKLFSQVHLVCLPSYREGLPKVLVEAASCGRAIVTTDVPGCRVIVEHGDNGLLVPAKNVDQLADALERLIVDAELRRRMGERGRERVIEKFSIDSVARATLDVYKELAP